MKPPKDGKIPANKKPRRLDRPGSPSRVGWYITAFGHRCLAYLENYDEAETSGGGEDVPGGPFDYDLEPSYERSLADIDTDDPAQMSEE